jgi:hypothetical protein
MATKNIVPRADGEGQIGTAAKKWAKVITTDLTLGTQAVSQAGKDLIDDATGADQLTTLGVSAAAKTILDDASVAAIVTTLGAAPLAPTGATYTPATGAQTVALNVSAVNMHVVSGHASGTAITFSITGAANNQPFIVSILQGGTTVSTITAWFATIRWASGTAPTLTATLNKRDTFGFIRTGANTYDGFVIGQNA